MNKDTFKNLTPIILLSVSSVAALVFTVVCMSLFKSGFLHEHATVITSLAVCVEIIYIAVTLIFYFRKFKTVFKCLLTGLVLGAFCIVLLFVLQVTGFLDKIDSVESLRELIDSAGVWAPLVFIVLQALQVFLLPIPGVLTVGAGVAMFGELETCIYSYIGILIGSLTAFWIGRVVGYKAAVWLVGKESLDKWLLKVKGKDRMILTAMFVLPLFPDDILCFVSGLSTMSWKYFIIMQLIARAISVVLTSYSLGGSIIPYNTWWGILLWLLIGIAIIALFIFLYKKGDKLERWFFGLFKSKKAEHGGVAFSDSVQQQGSEPDKESVKTETDEQDKAEKGQDGGVSPPENKT